VLTYEDQTLRSLEARLAKTLGAEGLARAREAGERTTLEEALSATQALLEATRTA
jgi:hypothetical protein